LMHSYSLNCTGEAVFVAKRTIKKPNIDLEVKKGIAWAVHAFTTCGIIAGFLALVEVLNNDPVKAFMWLGIALFVDGIDGSLARRARVREYTPNFDGSSLDYVIDFFTYVAVPAVMVYWFEMVPLDWIFAGTTWSLVGAATIMAVSCYTFANVGMKSEDYYFVGFPAIWNVVVLYFYVLDTGWLVNGLTIVILSILTFIPIKFVHPLRVTHWRNITIPMTILWATMTLFLVYYSKDKGTIDAILYGIAFWVWIAASLYFAWISLWRTFVQGDPDHKDKTPGHAT
jgi:phosphatidylcholine synthase